MRTLHARTISFVAGYLPQITLGITPNTVWGMKSVHLSSGLRSDDPPYTIGLEIDPTSKRKHNLVRPSTKPSRDALVLFKYYPGDFHHPSMFAEGFKNLIDSHSWGDAGSYFQIQLARTVPGEQVIVTGTHPAQAYNPDRLVEPKFVVKWNGKELSWYEDSPRTSEDQALKEIARKNATLSQTLVEAGDNAAALEALKSALVALYTNPADDSTVEQRAKIERDLLALQERIAGTAT
jgi:hypothetical protein